jgi:pyrimidine-specific ribonucleoside hydrolase
MFVNKMHPLRRRILCDDHNKFNSMKIFIVIILLFSITPVHSQQPVPVIFDTDMGPDYDDVGAIALLHSLADSGRANILATIASTNYEGVAAVLNVLNTYFKKPGLLIGVPKNNARDLRDWQHWSDTLQKKYPHTIHKNNEVPDATALYRKILSAQPDNSVTIITVGFFTNIASLLKSGPDGYSNLNGKALISKKVKQMVSMAGKFPSGLEFNIEEDKTAARYALENFPKQIIFSGFEIGEKIRSGLPLIRNTDIKNSPVKDVFSICIPMAKEDSAGRKSWDETAVLVAVSGYKPYYTLVPGSILIDSGGNNKWINKNKNQYYLVEKAPSPQIETLINNLMMHQPKQHP